MLHASRYLHAVMIKTASMLNSAERYDMQRAGFCVVGTFWILTTAVMAQPPGQGGGPGGPGGFGPGMRQTRKILKEFDTNSDGWLNDTERRAARESLKQSGNAGGGRRPFGPPGMNRNSTPPKEGVHV